MRHLTKLMLLFICFVASSCKKEAVPSTDQPTTEQQNLSANITLDAAAPAYTIRTIAGVFQPESSEPHLVAGPGPKAKFWKPHGVTVAADGSIYIADYLNNAIRKITIQNNVYTVPLSFNSQTGGNLLPEAVGLATDQTIYIVSSTYGIRIYNKAKGIDIYSSIGNNDSNLDLEKDSKGVMWFVNDNSLGRITGTNIQRNVVNFSDFLAANETLRAIGTAPSGVKYGSTATQLFKVSAEGKITKLFADQKFSFISGITVTKDGTTLYIVDGNAVKKIYQNRITIIARPSGSGDGKDGVGFNADVVAANLALSNSQKNLLITNTRNTIRCIALP